MKSKFEKYLSTYSGKNLLENNSLEDVGIWDVKGEDPNCDFGGHHHNPDIGLFQGTLKGAIEWGVNQPKFWTWGSGGEIKKVTLAT